MLRSAPDDFGAYYDPARKTRQVWRWEKMEQTALSQCGSNSASFFLYRRAKFIEKDREERMMKEEQERKRALEAKQGGIGQEVEEDPAQAPEEAGEKAKVREEAARRDCRSSREEDRSRRFRREGSECQYRNHEADHSRLA